MRRNTIKIHTLCVPRNNGCHWTSEATWWWDDHVIMYLLGCAYCAKMRYKVSYEKSTQNYCSWLDVYDLFISDLWHECTNHKKKFRIWSSQKSSFGCLESSISTDPMYCRWRINYLHCHWEIAMFQGYYLNRQREDQVGSDEYENSKWRKITPRSLYHCTTQLIDEINELISCTRTSTLILS